MSHIRNHVGKTPAARLLTAAKALREDMLMRAQIEDGHKVVDCSHSIWVRFNEAIKEMEGK